MAEISAANDAAAAALKNVERRLGDMAVPIKNLQAVAARGAGIPQGGYQGRRNHKAARSGRPESRVPGAGQQKARLYKQYCVKRELKEYGIIKQNVDSILRVTPGKAQAQEL